MTTHKTWREIKNERMKMCGGRCELCGYPATPFDALVGHHIVGRKLAERLGIVSVDICRIRHASCEAAAHQVLKNGNTKSEEELAQKYKGGH